MKDKALNHVSRLPEAKKLVEKRIVDPSFFKRVGNDLIKVIMAEATKAYKENSTSKFFDENLKAFSK